MRVKDIVQALSICHNVTPVDSTYQASSPDEMAIVKWTESVGLRLSARNISAMELHDSNGESHQFEILHTFPFTSETKRMGIVVRDNCTGEITFYEKGADVVMSRIVCFNGNHEME